MRRNSWAALMSKLTLSTHLFRQHSLVLHRKAHSKFHLWVFVVFTCVMSLLILMRSSNTYTLQLGHSSINKHHAENSMSYFHEAPSKVVHRGSMPLAACDIYTGAWIYDATLPIYNSSTCAFVELGFSCKDNGRPDSEYLNWRWQPQGCDLPLFDAQDIRQRLSGLRVAFVGDSMGRTQWESFICMLMADISDKSTVYELNGNSITKQRPYLSVIFSTFNFTVEYYRSPYLVEEGAPPKHVPKRVRSTLKLDKLETAASKWLHADILVFNTGHWWIQSKIFARGCYFQVDKSIKLGMSIQAAYRVALGTWAAWVEANLNSTKTHVFFRSYEPSHWEGSWRDRLCSSDTKPVLNSSYSEDFPHLPVLLDVVQNMTVPVNVLNITSMSSYRRDSHVANWTREQNVVDCGHWCLPGLPDTWNRLLYAALLQRWEGRWANQ